MDSRIIIRNSVDSRSYDASIGDQVIGTIVYEPRDGRMVIRHTVVDPEFRGYAKLVDGDKPGRAHPRDAALRAAQSRP